MSEITENENYQVVWIVRRLFRAMAQKSTKNLEGLGITAADRAVLEFLYPDKKLSVPGIAELYKVSRQHVQVTINRLMEKGLITSKVNPRHKRSVHMMLTTKGRTLFTRVMKLDEQAVSELFSDIPNSEVTTTLSTLKSLLNKLSGEEIEL